MKKKNFSKKLIYIFLSLLNPVIDVKIKKDFNEQHVMLK